MDYLSKLELDEEQSRAATYDINANLQIIAGPGTGKTRALTGRVAHLLESGVEPDKILVLSFTNQAMRAFQERLTETIGEISSVDVFTFHAFCQQLLRSHGSYLQPSETSKFDWTVPWSVADSIDQEQLLTHARRHLNSSEAIPRYTKSALTQINQQKARSLTDPDWVESFLVRVYNEELHSVQLLDYADLLLYGKKLVSQFGDKFLHYSHILVDEFQDTAPTKWAFLKTIIEKTKASLTVVGDPSQSIFSFQGADGQIFKHMKRDFPDTQVVQLLTNHRSTNQIVALSNELMRNQIQLRGTFDGAKPVFMEFQNSADESMWISAEIEHLLAENPSLSMKDFAILSRTNAAVNSITGALERVAKLPTVSYGSAYVLLHQPGIMVLYTVLKIIESGQHTYNAHGTPVDIATLALLQNEKSGPILTVSRARQVWKLSKDKNLTIPDALRTYASKNQKNFRKSAELSQFCKFIEEAKLVFSNKYTYKDIWNILDQLISMWKLESREKNYSVSRLYKIIRELSIMSRNSNDSLLQVVIDNVRLQNFGDTPDKLISSTIHNAKGLEWPFVFITGVKEGVIPLQSFPNSLVDYEEERRLLYVAATRAVQKVYFTMSRSQILGPLYYGMDNTRYEPTKRSRYLDNNVMKHIEVGHKRVISAFGNSNMKNYLQAKKQYSKLFQIPPSTKFASSFCTLASQLKRRAL